MNVRNEEEKQRKLIKVADLCTFGTISGGSRVSAQSCAKLLRKEILELTVNGFTKDIYYE